VTQAARLASGIYTGRVNHARTKPRRHRLAYRIFMLLIDLDELDALKPFRLLGIGRFSLLGFDPGRHGDGSGRPLKAQVEALLADAGIAHGGPVRVLAMPQVLGRAFNPLTVYFCHDRAGALSAILYEVNNTFGERHRYLIPAPDADVISQACGKAFYVSPFMDMALSYAFHLRRPDQTVMVAVNVSDAEGLLLSASFAGERQDMSDAALFRAWAGRPWMTVGVLAAIHWEALKIWLKGEKIRHRTPARPNGLTVAPQARLAV